MISGKYVNPIANRCIIGVLLRTAAALKAALWQALDPLPDTVVAFKSIAAYRSGLNIAVDTDEALVKCVMNQCGWV